MSQFADASVADLIVFGFSRYCLLSCIYYYDTFSIQDIAHEY